MLKKLITLAVAGALSAFSVSAEELSLKDDHPTTYIVKKGDTLWDISETFLDNPWLWPQLWHANPDVANPHLIYPGDVLSLIWVDGQPRLTLKKVVKVSPSVRVEEKPDPIASVDNSILLPYLEFDALVDSNQLNMLPRVLGSTDARAYLSPRETLYVDEVLSGEKWHIYRVTSQFSRSVGGETVQVHSLKRVADADFDSANAHRSALSISRIYQEVLPNDVLMPALEQANDAMFIPSPAPESLDGEMVGHLYGSNYLGKGQVVVVNRGINDGLSSGNIMQIYSQGSHVAGSKGNFKYTSSESDADFVLPEKVLGSAMVIRTYPAFSLAVIMESLEPLTANLPVRAPSSS